MRARAALLRSSALAAFCLVGLSLAPAASAAVSRDGDTFAPRSSAELVEAAAIITAERPSVPVGASRDYRLHLVAAHYELAEPLVIRAAGSVIFTSGESLDHPAVLTNAGPPHQLLDVETAAGFRHEGGWAEAQSKEVIVTLLGQTTDAFPLVVLRGGTLDGFDVRVGEGTPNVVAVRAGASAVGGSSIVDRSTVQSTASVAAVELGAGGAIYDSTVVGGAPTVSVSAGAATLAPEILRSYLFGSATSGAVLRLGAHVRTGTTVGSSIIDGSAGTSTLIDVSAPGSGPGVRPVLLRNLTLDGTSAATALRVRSSPVRAPGLLAIGTGTLLACEPVTDRYDLVAIDGFWSSAEPAASEHCNAKFIERRTGELRLSDVSAGDYRPRYDSPLIDGSLTTQLPFFNESTGSSTDFLGSARDLFGGGAGGADRRRDIGALEYQRAVPQVLVTDQIPLDDAGLVRFESQVFDPDPGEADELTYRWSVDGVEQAATGPTFEHRFSAADGSWRTVEVVVTDVTGQSGADEIWVDEELIGPGSPENPDGRDEDGDPFAPGGPVLGRPTPPLGSTPTPPAKPKTPALAVSAKLVRSKVSRRTRYISTEIQPPTSRMGVLDVTSNRRVDVLISAWQLKPVRKGKKKSTKIVFVRGAKDTLVLQPGVNRVGLTALVGDSALKPGLYELRLRLTSGKSIGTFKIRVAA